MQLLDACGWAGQAAFAWRTASQWIASERAGRIVVPHGFWTWSLVGTALTLTRNAGRGDAVFVMGDVVMGFVFARNAWLTLVEHREDRAEKPAAWPLITGLLVFIALVVADGVLRPGTSERYGSVPAVWAIVGFAGQTAWTGRFVAQWWASEKKGRSVLPVSFFSLGLVGSMLLLAYAIVRADPVNIAAQVLNPIPYGRNLWLWRKSARADAARARDDATS